MRSLGRFRTLRGRLGFFFAFVLSVSLAVFAATVYGIVVAVESEDPDPTGEEQRELVRIRHDLLLALGLAVPAGLVVAIGGATWLTRKAFVSLEDVVRTAALLGPDNIHARVPSFAGAGVEVEQVAAALNAMLDRLERAVLGLRRFTAHAAHELRTPLTVVLGNLEISLRRPHDAASVRTTMEEAHEELERMTQLVEALLTLARSDASELAIQSTPVDVVDVVTKVLELYEMLASQRGIKLRLHHGLRVSAHSDSLWLSRIVVNLVDNACKFTPAGGQVDVHVEASPGGIRLIVEDTGPGVPEDERVQIFDRFFRGAYMRSAHPGFGLGLSLAKDLATALGGSLALESRTDGRAGARFVLRVPISVNSLS